MSDRPAELIERLGLQPHPEGGHYAEIFRSGHRVSDGRDRSAVTTIYYLLRRGDVSRWHVVSSDEVWHLYEGDGLELVTFDPESQTTDRAILGAASDRSRPVHVVRAGHWQAVRPTGGYALAGCTVAPGFEFEDFRFVADLPDHDPPFTAGGPLAGYRDLL